MKTGRFSTAEDRIILARFKVWAGCSRKFLCLKTWLGGAWRNKEVYHNLIPSYVQVLALDLRMNSEDCKKMVLEFRTFGKGETMNESSIFCGGGGEGLYFGICGQIFELSEFFSQRSLNQWPS